MPRPVLVVEDEESIRRYLTDVLQKQGYNVDTATDGVAAVEKLATKRYDAVILDLIMPRLDGFGVLRFIEANDASILSKVVVATAYPRDAAKAELREICRVVMKPLDPARLLDAVRECVEFATDDSTDLREPPLN
jgi:DNA-binding response OmpR family regulator